MKTTKGPVFAKQGTFEEIYPEVADVTVKVKQTGEGCDGRTLTYLRRNLPGDRSPCSNPECRGGGFRIGALLNRMVRQHEEQGEDVISCTGNEGGRHKKRCLNSARVRISISYRAGR